MVKVKTVMTSNPHFTELAGLKVICVELVFYWSTWFITGCVIVNTVWEDMKGPGNGAIDWGLPQKSAAHHSTHQGPTVLGRCFAKRQQTNTPWDVCSWHTFTLMYLLWRWFFWWGTVVLKEKLWSQDTHGWHKLMIHTESKSFRLKSF